ncbi:GNAT family N-acetyltransferase [Xenophilus sp. AP218F]|nr:GNAT family protein [Chromobacterium sp. ASV5]OWY37877.1 GNAT family N-acetyltransferase [Xenophilus sp. AP218F]
MSFPTLTTQRLLLRELAADDAPALFAIHSDAEAMQWFGTDPLTEPAQALQLIETFRGWRNQPNPGTRWGIVRQRDRQLIGSCGLFRWNLGWHCCALGYELARPAWGQGYMSEALGAILPWGFQHMALNRVEAQVHPDNAASLKLLRKLGFQQEGRLRQAGYWLGRYQDLLQLALLRQDLPIRP